MNALTKVNRMDKLIVSLKDIRSATDNFSDHNIIGHGALGTIYKGTVGYAKGEILIVAKRLNGNVSYGEHQSSTELDILLGRGGKWVGLGWFGSWVKWVMGPMGQWVKQVMF
ncbi:kinase-like domain, phloem protein 2-like protein [Tanacetum coccineum]